jgi:hypothetical protein
MRNHTTQAFLGPIDVTPVRIYGRELEKGSAELLLSVLEGVAAPRLRPAMLALPIAGPSA